MPDLDVTFSGSAQRRAHRRHHHRPRPEGPDPAHASSDDLVALTEGDLNFGQAWLAGRVKVEAGVRDLLKLRSML